LYKNKEHGMISAAASLGALLLWDVDGGLTQIDKFLYSTDNHIKAGALLAVGILNTGLKNECDPALALLTEYVESPTPLLKIAAAFGLGLAYVGSQREEVSCAHAPRRAHVTRSRAASREGFGGLRARAACAERVVWLCAVSLSVCVCVSWLRACVRAWCRDDGQIES
jgi:hypothetical protein